MVVVVPVQGPAQNVPGPWVMITAAPSPVFGSVRFAGSSPGVSMLSPGATYPLETPGSGASTVVVSVVEAFDPGEGSATFWIVPLAGTVEGLVTTTLATAVPPGAIGPTAQSITTVPLHPLSAVADLNVAPEENESVTWASATVE